MHKNVRGSRPANQQIHTCYSTSVHSHKNTRTQTNRNTQSHFQAVALPRARRTTSFGIKCMHARARAKSGTGGTAAATTAAATISNTATSNTPSLIHRTQHHPRPQTHRIHSRSHKCAKVNCIIRQHHYPAIRLLAHSLSPSFSVIHPLLQTRIYALSPEYPPTYTPSRHRASVTTICFVYAPCGSSIVAQSTRRKETVDR